MSTVKLSSLTVKNDFLSYFRFQPTASGTDSEYDNYANIVCRTQDETMITINGKHISADVNWTRVQDVNISYTTIRLNSSWSNILELGGGHTFGVIFSGRIPYEAYSNPGGILFPELEENNPINLDESVSFAIPPLKDYVAPNGSVITSESEAKNETSIFDEFFSLKGTAKEKITAGITVTVIVVLVIVAKVLFCLFTLRTSNI